MLKNSQSDQKPKLTALIESTYINQLSTRNKSSMLKIGGSGAVTTKTDNVENFDTKSSEETTLMKGDLNSSSDDYEDFKFINC